MQTSLRSALFTLPVFAAASAGALGQEALPFTIDQGQSTWMWSGTTSLGSLVGNPDQDFSVSGTMNIVIEPDGAQRLATGQVLSALADVTPDLSGIIPNPIPVLPPLAQIDITNLSLDFATDPFTIDGGGNFTTDVVVTALSGTLTVTPLVGSQTVTDLANTSGDPTQISGTISQAGGTITFNSPQSAQFDFTDSGSGISASLNLDGTLAGDYDCPPPSDFCVTTPNSVGSGALIGTSGSTSIFANDLMLVATGVPNQPGIFFYGPDQTQVPFGNGSLCIAGQITRFDAAFASGNVLMAPMDYNPPAPVRAGSTFNFQTWYRDPDDGGAFFNLSNGTSITFCP